MSLFIVIPIILVIPIIPAIPAIPIILTVRVDLEVQVLKKSRKKYGYVITCSGKEKQKEKKKYISLFLTYD